MNAGGKNNFSKKSEGKSRSEIGKGRAATRLKDEGKGGADTGPAEERGKGHEETGGSAEKWEIRKDMIPDGEVFILTPIPP